jgi:RNA polymerase sigma factor (sigma-70 family)
MMTRVRQVGQQLRQMLGGEGVAGLGDAELLQRFLSTREEEAFAALVHRHGPLVLEVCRRILQNSHDAEDAFQATFLVLARRAAAIRQPDSLAAWLHGVTLRLARTMKRDAGRRRRLEMQAPPPEPQGPVDPARRELHCVLHEELGRLPRKHRQPLLLCYLEGLTQEEAARQLGWPRGTLKRRLERGRKLLERRLSRRGLSLGAALVALQPGETLARPLPTTLGSTTIRAVVPFAAQQMVPATLAPAHVTALAEGMLKTMLAAKVKLLLFVLVCALGTLGALVGVQAAHRPADRFAAEGEIRDSDAGEEPGPKRLAKDEPPQRERVLPSRDRVPDPKTTAETTKRFEDLAGKLAMFPTGDFVYGRADRTDLELGRFVPKKWSEPWLEVYAALSTGRDNVDDLVGLLKHKDPRVRTLALAALFDRQGPKLLPHLAALVGDKEKTVPEVQIRRHLMASPKEVDLLPQDFKEQTVGDVAAQLVNCWLYAAGYTVKDFESYWGARKDREFCASWFLVRFNRAGQGTSSFDKKRAPLIRAIRKDIDALPETDRDWVLLWLAANTDSSSSDEPNRLLATPEERVAAGKRLGPDRLMDLIQDKPISKDPDLAAKDRRTRDREYLILWVLRHAGQLLRPEDAPAILEMEKSLRGQPPWCAIAAAELQPAKAREWLRGAIGRFAGEPVYTHLAWSRADLAAGLWRIVGPSEIDYLADWFYGETVNKNPHSTQTGRFLEAIRGVRAPADRKLVARLVADARLDKLDYQSLRSLVEVVNGWTKAPVVAAEELRPGWERGTLWPETARDLKVLAGWREKLKNSVAEWNPPGK